MRIYLTRHAQEAQDSQTAEGAITPLGEKQARTLARFLSGKDIQALYSSALERALQTAEVVGERLSLPVKVKEDLQEIKTSSPEDWSDYIESHHPDFDFLVGGNESVNMLSKRAKAALEEIVESEKEGNIAIVAHGVFTKALLYALGFKEHLMRNDHVANTGVTILDYDGEKFDLVKFNKYTHLAPLRALEILENTASKVFKKS